MLSLDKRGLKEFLKRIYAKYFPYDIFFVLFIGFIVVFLLSNLNPGIYASDEIVYLLMVKSLADDGRLDIWNGYDEIQAKELVFIGSVFESNGRIYSQYPQFYTFIAYPFYKTLGFYGLFIINVISFIIVLCILYKTVILIFNDKFLAVFTVFAYAFFTYSLEFSIDLWPHMLSVCLTIMPFYLILAEYMNYLKRGCGSNSTTQTFFISGLISGIAVGVRYQNILFSIILFLFLLVTFKLKSASFLTGFSIPFLLLLAINYYTHQGLTSYPTNDIESFGEYQYFYFFIFSLVLIALSYISHNLNRRQFLFISLTLVSILLLFFHILDDRWFDSMKTSLQIIYAEVVDMQSFPFKERVYAEKNALLQSSPFLILALFAPAIMHKKGFKRELVYLLALYAVIEILFFSARIWHGGDTRNMRYFLEGLPFLTLFSVYSIENIIKERPSKSSIVYTISGVSIFFATIYACTLFSRKEFSTIISAIVFLVFLTVRFFKDRPQRAKAYSHSRVIFICFLVAAYSCSFISSLMDFLSSSESRRQNNILSSKICEGIINDSIVICNKIDILFPLGEVILCGKARIAYANLGDENSTRRLINFYLKRNTPVYLMYPEDYNLSERGSSENLTIIDIRGIAQRDFYINSSFVVPVNDYPPSIYSSIANYTIYNYTIVRVTSQPKTTENV